MEQNLHSGEIYDFRRYDQVWQRVGPQMEPYPARSEVSAGTGSPAGTACPAAQPAPLMPARESLLPGAEADPCCMGSVAMESLEVLAGFEEEEREACRQYRCLARCAPVWARQTLREMAEEKEQHVRRLEAVRYLITGQCNRAMMHSHRSQSEPWCTALRRAYHQEACSGFNYARAAQGTTDVCLSELLNGLSRCSYRNADMLLTLLEKSLRRC